MTDRAPIVQRADARAARREEEDAFFRDMQSGMPEKSQRVIESLRRVRQVYVPCGRDTALLNGFNRMLEQFHASRGQVREEADIYLLLGQSGAGKTAAIGRLLREHPSLQTRQRSFGPITPYVSIKLKGYTLPRLVAAQIVRAAGYGQLRSDGQGEMWDGLNEALRSQFVFIVHIDEAQHMLSKGATVKERIKLADAIKGASIDPEWPIIFILSGLPEVMEIPRADEQIARRGNLTIFTDVVIEDERDLVEEIMRKLAAPVGIDAEHAIQGDVPERLAYAANDRYARICQLVVSAIQEALHQGNDTLGPDHFGTAYERRTATYGRTELNPFLATGWRSLKRGSFIEFIEGGE